MCRRKLFKYGILKLIELIEKTPLIWDKTHKHHKHKVKKQKAWRDIYRTLDNNYDKADENKQKEIGEAITTKWIYLRDAFYKSLRTAAGEGSTKKYIYYDQLTFLFKDDNTHQMYDVQSTAEEATTPPPNVDDECGVTPSSSCKVEKESTPTSTKRGVKRKMERDILQVVQDGDEDDAFFKSIKPAVLRMNEDDKYDFRMGVMRLIQQIKKQNHNASPSLSTLTAVSHSNSAVLAQPLIKQYAPDNSSVEETVNNSAAEMFSYMILPVKKTEEGVGSSAEEMFGESDVSDV